MDFNDYDHPQPPTEGTDRPSSPPPIPGPAPRAPYPIPDDPPRRRGGGWRIFWGILFFFSVLANIGMFFLLIGMFFFVVGGHQRGLYQEEVLKTGAHTNKIVVINISGIIDDGQSESLRQQLELARKDDALCGVILRVNSPGGSVSASDLIYHELVRFKTEKKVPLVAFMQGVAASGGYYASVACDKIVSEPTVITGSIGVIMNHFVIGDLLENKLGITPVVVKSGEKKDWPSSYQTPSDDQMKYLQERVIKPAFSRFLEVVAEGRKEVLTPEQISPLADGGIYTAQEAMNQHLIDQVGYFEDAIDVVKGLASVFSAQVVQYEPAFSLSHLLGAKSSIGLKINQRTLLEWSQPQAMYLWKAY